MLRKTSIAIAISIALAAAGSTSSASANSVLKANLLQESFENVSASKEQVRICIPIPFVPWQICF